MSRKKPQSKPDNLIKPKPPPPPPSAGKMNYHKKPETKEEIYALDNMLYKQCVEAANIKLTGEITCICGKKHPVFNLFRCYYYGLWLRDECCKEHFGQRPVGKRTVEARDKC